MRFCLSVTSGGFLFVKYPRCHLENAQPSTMTFQQSSADFLDFRHQRSLFLSFASTSPKSVFVIGQETWVRVGKRMDSLLPMLTILLFSPSMGSQEDNSLLESCIRKQLVEPWDIREIGEDFIHLAIVLSGEGANLERHAIMADRYRLILWLKNWIFFGPVNNRDTYKFRDKIGSKLKTGCCEVFWRPPTAINPST